MNLNAQISAINIVNEGLELMLAVLKKEEFKSLEKSLQIIESLLDLKIKLKELATTSSSLHKYYVLKLENLNNDEVKKIILAAYGVCTIIISASDFVLFLEQNIDKEKIADAIAPNLIFNAAYQILKVSIANMVYELEDLEFKEKIELKMYDFSSKISFNTTNSIEFSEETLLR